MYGFLDMVHGMANMVTHCVRRGRNEDDILVLK
jgi:hypothetical protein